MATKSTFTVDGAKVTNLFNTFFSYITDAKFRIISTEGKSILNMPLYLAILLGIFLPFLTVTALIIVLVMSYKIEVERKNESKELRIENK